MGVPKRLSKMDNPEKLATRRKKRKTEHNMCWALL